ncbi:hypothetical protein HC031_29750 [Planosporangium thailandense]|uniref:Uncharacterized protein n=1 Tax=Planosporangium thailandense TaxID=765197 RepID=A0ABX0Y641_9ACTN|nr:hypothetical protein [Planosporangium thailandense]NJC73866.1 hypothetical protein [Planosporangium thailandense]
MGTLRGGNGGGWSPDELPELPPEWGPVVIPDDPAELAREASKVRRELRWEARRLRWRRRLHLPAPRSRTEDAAALGVPLLVVLIATIATLTSLFIISWPRTPPRPELRPSAVASPSAGTTGNNPGGPSPQASAPAAPAAPAPTATGTPRTLTPAQPDPAGSPPGG